MMYPQSIDKDGNPKKGATKSSDTILTAYGGSRIHHHGTINIDCEFRGKSSTAQFYVTTTQGPAIIGLPTATDLKLIKFNCAIQKQRNPPNMSPPSTQSSPRSHTGPTQMADSTENPAQPPPPKPIKSKEDLIEQFPDCFDGIGKFQGKYHITTDPSVPPVIHPPRRIPISLKDDIKKELDEMIANDIITKIKKESRQDG